MNTTQFITIKHVLHSSHDGSIMSNKKYRYAALLQSKAREAALQEDVSLAAKFIRLVNTYWTSVSRLWLI